MAKYADITPFYEWLEWIEKESNTKRPGYETLMFYEIIDKLDSLPEVVRCKDCKYGGSCEVEYLLREADKIENPYCAGGKRREEDG